MIGLLWLANKIIKVSHTPEGTTPMTIGTVVLAYALVVGAFIAFCRFSGKRREEGDAIAREALREGTREA